MRKTIRTKTMRSCFLYPCVAMAAFASLAGLTGCGIGKLAPPEVDQPSVTGRIMGGQQPVAGVSVQLYESGISGYGAAATALGAAVPTTALGNFTLPDYTCDSNRVLYIVGTGGQPIAATQTTAAVTNNNLAMMGILGVCNGAMNTFVNVNELTTVADIWATQQFMTDPSHLSTSSTNTAGLLDSVVAAYQLVDPGTGTLTSTYTPAGALIPTDELNTLADMLEQCVNSGGGSHGDNSNCGNLFALAPDASGVTYPTDTIAAALNIAKNPGRNVALLNRVRSASPVFQPALDVNSPPSSWTIAVTYTGGGLSQPSSVTLDASGSVWVTNSGNNSVTKLDALGNALSPASGFTAMGMNLPASIAIDQQGAAWIASSGSNSLVKLNNDGTAQNTVQVLSGAKSVSIDTSGDAVLTNGNSVMTVNPSGTVEGSFSTPGTVLGVVNTAK